MLTDAALAALAARLGERLLRRGIILATAESCTGGWIAKVLTDASGSSQWFERGYVTYSNASKIELLGVRPATLEAHGAVSEATVREMATGAQARGHAQAAVAVTGIAGPDGGTPAKPVGTVFFAYAWPGRECMIESGLFPGDRESVRRQAVQTVLQRLYELAGDA